MSKTDGVRVGIVGAGGIVRARHLPGLAAISGVELTAVANRSMESGQKVADEWKIPQVYADWRRVIDNPDVDAVIIGTWPYMHCEVTLAALEAGKHVFCQARMAMNLREASRMREAARASDHVTMLCPPPHGLKGDRVMQRLLHEEHFVGHPRLIRLTNLNGAYADPATPLHWRQDARFSGRNVLTLGIYAEVLQRWLGPVVELAALLSTHVPMRLSPTDTHQMVHVEIPDSVSIVGRMESGADLTIDMSGVVRHGPQDTIEIYGDAGALIYNFAEDTIGGQQKAGPWSEIEISPEDERRWTVEDDFIAGIRQGREVHPDFEDGYRYMEVVEAAWVSSNEGRRVGIPLASF